MHPPADENWKPVTGYENFYDASDHGRVRRLPRSVEIKDGSTRTTAGKMLRPFQHGRTSHLAVKLMVNGERKRRPVHRLVLEAFVGPYPEGMECCHADGDPTNNHLDNLRWDTRSANSHDSVKHGSHAMSLRTHCPRGHVLELPNLRASLHAKGGRACLACDRAKAYARKYNQMDKFEEIADQRYAAIMKR